MALSLLQEAQTARGLAAVRAMAGMKHEDERALSISPPINNNNNNTSYNNNNLNNNNNNNNNDTSHLMYPGGFNTAAAAASAMGMSQLIAANQRAAAIMAAGLPMSLRATLASATGLFPHYPGLFAAWAPQQQQQQQNSKSPSPTSPISPVLSTKSSKKLNNNNHIVSTTTGDLPVVQKKANKRKQISVKKDLMSPKLMTQPVEIPVSVDMISQGPISPPTSGSSPQSNGSIDQVPPVHSTPGKDPCRDKVFTCKICNRSFGYKHVLQNHERTHTGEKPFECPECHKRFTRDHHLKTHMRLHTGEKPYHCSHCDRHFVQVANLRRHLRVHTGERPYTCEICQAKFSDSNQLKAHMLMHNGEKPFRCDRCHTNFRRRHHLMHHKCGITSPPTPAMSPVMSLSDQKSASSRSEVSDESIEIKPTSLHHYPAIQSPLGIAETDVADPVEKRNRKSRDIRRVIRMAPQIIHVPTDLPEQTEPEDLSMHSPRSPASLVSMHDEDLDDLDDAASLYMKQRITKLHLPHSMES